MLAELIYKNIWIQDKVVQGIPKITFYVFVSKTEIMESELQKYIQLTVN